MLCKTTPRSLLYALAGTIIPTGEKYTYMIAHPINIPIRRPSRSAVYGTAGRAAMDPRDMMALRMPRSDPLGWLKYSCQGFKVCRPFIIEPSYPFVACSSPGIRKRD